MRIVLLATIVCASPALAQSPAPDAKPADDKATAQKPRAPLKLRLDEVNGAAPLITFTPREAEKKEPAAGLPSLGGRPSSTLERPISDVVPKDLTPGQ
jgi:hypothetical protein